jgi:hypothetical protein
MRLGLAPANDRGAMNIPSCEVPQDTGTLELVFDTHGLG